MNDIEKLIAGLPRPLPSPKLDARISELTRKPVNAQVARERLQRFGVLVACTTCAGLMGFLFGRQTAFPLTGLQVDHVARAAPIPPIESASERPSVHFHEPPTEALARFVMPAKRIEGLFGCGPLEERSGPSHLE